MSNYSIWKISKLTIFTVIAYMLMFVNLPYFAQYRYVKYAMIVILGLFVLSKANIIIAKKYRVVNLTASLFGFLVMFTSYFNQSRLTDRNPFLASIVFVATFLLFLFFMEIVAEDGKVKQVFKSFYILTFIFTILTDLIMFASPNLVNVYGGNYFIGTKFSVVYLHLFLLMLNFANLNLEGKKKFRKRGLFFYFAWVLIISIYVDCATGVVGAVIYLALIYFIEKKEGLFFKKTFFVGALALSFGFVFFNEFVLGSSFIQKIIIDLLGRDATLTSRTIIFEQVILLLSKYGAWWTGFGYGSSYELGMQYGRFPDTQNGIMEWIWQAGIPATIMLVLMFVSLLAVADKYVDNLNKKALIPMLAGLYLFIVLATIEVTIGLLYIGIAICMLCVSTNRSSNQS